MLARLGMASLALVAVLTASATVHAQCTKDTDCKGERVCEEGACVPGSPAPAAPAAPAVQGAPAPAAEPAAVAAPPAAGVAAAPAPAATPVAPVQPAAPVAPPAPQTKRNSPGMMAAGIVMISTAPIALLVAAVAAGQKTSCKNDPYYYDPVTLVPRERNDCDGYDPTIYGFTIGGIALFAAGIPLFIVGSKRVPLDDKAKASVSPWVSQEGAGATLRLTL
ncbi:MAG TPA: hypothetical protein VGK73_12710 [Polyangiaceae bacterium]